MRVSSDTFYASIYTLKTWKCWCQSLCYETTVCVVNFNNDNDRNVLYPSNIFSKVTIIFNYWLPKCSSCQCNHSHFTRSVWEMNKTPLGVTTSNSHRGKIVNLQNYWGSNITPRKKGNYYSSMQPRSSHLELVTTIFYFLLCHLIVDRDMSSLLVRSVSISSASDKITSVTAISSATLFLGSL